MGSNDGVYTKIGAIAGVVGTVVALIAVLVGTSEWNGGKGTASTPIAGPGPVPDAASATSAPSVATSTLLPAPPTEITTPAPNVNRIYYLADLPHVEGSNPYRGVIAINGKQYVHSIYQIGSTSRPTATQFDLKRQCDQFEFTAGITDDSSSQYVSRFEIYGDNRLLKSFQLEYGRDAHYALDVKDVLRLTVQNIIIQRTNAFYRAGWGDAAIRCSRTFD